MRSHVPALLVLSGALALASCSDGGITVTPTDPCAPQTLAFPGSAAGNVTQTECRVGGRPAAFHRITVPAGSVQFDVSGDFPPEVAILATADTDHVFQFNNTNSVTGVWLLPAGQYLVRVVARSGTGAYTVTGSNHTGQNCVERFLVPFADVTYSRQLTATACVNSDDGSFFDGYITFSSRPCTITMRSTQMDSYLYLINARTGAVLAQDDDSGGGVDARVSLAACNAGSDVLGIVANTAFVGETGAYTLTVAVPGGPPAP